MLTISSMCVYTKTTLFLYIYFFVFVGFVYIVLYIILYCILLVMYILYIYVSTILRALEFMTISYIYEFPY